MDKETKIAFEFLEDLRGKGKIKDKTTDLENNISKEFEQLQKVVPQEFKKMIEDTKGKIFCILSDIEKEYFELGVLLAETMETITSEGE
ncbi:MAG: hypothetical protein ACRCX7_08930 [Cetobacterium sp.]|uniref:hypothetical protein n=1 Tax=Cetobacterium sp. TaxID=2071632 RepID=UPI003EE77E46